MAVAGGLRPFLLTLWGVIRPFKQCWLATESQIRVQECVWMKERRKGWKERKDRQDLTSVKSREECGKRRRRKSKAMQENVM
jgi:hypothetical protein